MNARKRAVLPVVQLNRGQLADSLARLMSQLGLERRAQPVKSLQDYIWRITTAGKRRRFEHSRMHEQIPRYSARRSGAACFATRGRHGGHSSLRGFWASRSMRKGSKLSESTPGEWTHPLSHSAKFTRSVAGRSGKSLIAAMTATYLAAFRDYEAILAPGEIGVLPIIAPDRKQCRVILNYIAGFFGGKSRALASMVKVRLKESIELEQSNPD